MTHAAAHLTSATFDAQLKVHRKILLQLLMFGAIALALAPFGEMSLSRSSPIFAFLGLTYGAWQMSYFFGLLVLGLAWLGALVQRLNIIGECRARRNQKLRLEADREAQMQRRRAARAAPPPEPVSTRRNSGKSSKFDY